MHDATILHASDCHLGSREHRGVEEDAFRRLIDLAAKEDVDALLIAGDLFDSARVSGDLVRWAGKQLERLSCEVVILPGNHDCLLPGSPYHVHVPPDWCRTALVIMDTEGQLLHLAGGRIVVWGKPCVDHAPWFRPLAGLPRRPADAFAVVMAHGLVVEGADEETVRGSPIHEWELEVLDWDYVALGHRGRYHVVREAPLVVYAGETAPGAGHGGGAVLVRSSGGRVTIERRVLADPVRASVQGHDETARHALCS